MPQRRFLENVTQLNCSNSALLQRLTNIEELEENLAKEKLKDPDYKASLVKKMAQEKLSNLPNKNDKGSRSHIENKIRKFFLNYEFKSWFLTDCLAAGIDKNNAELMLKEIDGEDGKDANEENKAARKKAREKMSLESWFIAHHPTPITRLEAKELLKNEQTRSAAQKGMSKEQNDDGEKKNDSLGFAENETLNSYESFLKYVFHRDEAQMSKDRVLEYIRTDSQFVNPDPRWTAEMKLEHLQQSDLQLSELNNSSIDFLCKIGVDFQLLRKTAITATCEQSAAATSIPLPLEIKTELYYNEETKELIAFHLRGDEQINEDNLKGLTRYDDIEGIGLSTGRVSPLTLEHVAKNHPELTIKHKFSNTLREPFKVTDREGNLIQSPFPDYLFTNLGSGFLRMCVKGGAIEQIKSEIGDGRAEFADFTAVINQEERDLYRPKNVGYVADNAASFGRFLQSNFQWLSENSFVRGGNNSNRPVQDNVFPSVTVFSKSIADTTNLGGNDFHNDYLAEQMKRELNALNDCDIICTGHVTSVLIKDTIRESLSGSKKIVNIYDPVVRVVENLLPENSRKAVYVVCDDGLANNFKDCAYGEHGYQKISGEEINKVIDEMKRLPANVESDKYKNLLNKQFNILRTCIKKKLTSEKQEEAMKPEIVLIIGCTEIEEVFQLNHHFAKGFIEHLKEELGQEINLIYAGREMAKHVLRELSPSLEFKKDVGTSKNNSPNQKDNFSENESTSDSSSISGDDISIRDVKNVPSNDLKPVFNQGLLRRLSNHLVNSPSI